MPHRTFLSNVLAALSWGIVTLPAHGQALLPYTPQLDPEQLEQNGLDLIQEAAQLTRFQQYQLALPRAELATQLAPNNYQTWALLGSLYLQVDRTEEGIKNLQKAQSLAPKDEPGVRFALGEAYFRQKQYQKAVDEIEAGLKIRSDVPGALFDLGNSYLMLGQYDAAIAHYEKAFAQEKNLWPAINNIGLVHYEKGEIDQAITQWEAAVAIDQKAAEPLLALAVALYTQGKVEEGVATGETALKIDGRYADIDFLKDNLWGDRLIGDTMKFLATPQMQETIAQLAETSPSETPTP
ncbi:MAG: tetratricopeptide repeat protein [Oscillatoriales cyanobacterium RM2_1_1]|nr:tetratricopeptide repeat protein [Oscillatoriales cyanobacterium SM2_3_0]NJO46273.1 tetratricopeptide repeat protein [Oscillatoriales cyanobacterium RM2_1_1]